MRLAISTTLVAFFLAVLVAAATDPWDKTLDYNAEGAITIWAPNWSNNPQIILYAVKNLTSQRMNYRVDCTLRNERLGSQDISTRWLDNVRPGERGFGKAVLRGFVDNPPQGLHCRVSNNKPSVTYDTVDSAEIVGRLIAVGKDARMTYRLTNSSATTMSYQVECWIRAKNTLRDVIVDSIQDVPASSTVEGFFLFPNANVYGATEGGCRVANAAPGTPGH